MHQQAFWQLLGPWQHSATVLALSSSTDQRFQGRALTLNILLTALLVPWRDPSCLLCLSAGALGLLLSSAASTPFSASPHSLMPLLPMLGTESSASVPEPFQVRCLSGSPGVIASACHLLRLSRSVYRIDP